jgi:glycosyltransferase involved in cell wall biosynthesis
MLVLAGGLIRSGWEVTVACPADGDTWRRAGEQGIPRIDFHPRKDYNPFAAVRLRRLVDAMEIDVLHAHHSRAHGVALMAALLAKRPVALLVSRRVSFPVRRNWFSLMKYRSRRIDSFIAVAESIRWLLIDGGVEAERVVTIPSSVDTEIFSPHSPDDAVARELALPAGIPVVLVIANFSEWKGQQVQLAAASLLKREGRPVVSLFAGRDTDSPAMREAVRAAGLAEVDVRLLGLRDDVPRLLSIAAVSVVPSVAGEGLSGAVRESLAMRVPVVASDLPGNAEIVTDGVTGRLFPSGDATALARVIGELLADREGAQRMAEAGRLLVTARYGVQPMVDATATLYRKLSARRCAKERA